MLCKRTIELRKPLSSRTGSLIPLETLADCARDTELLNSAQDQADEILRHTHLQRDQLLLQAQHEFWQRANRQLHLWHTQQQAILDNIERIATSVTHSAIRSLLEDTTTAQRVSAMLKQMLAAQAPAIRAKLVCNPQDQADVEHWLDQHTEAPWRLQCDESIAPQVLILEAEEGSFRIDWTSSINALLVPHSDFVSEA